VNGTSHEEIIYEILNNQYQFQWERTHDIESKAVNIVLFSGIILGLEFNLLSDLYNYEIGSIGNSLYYLVAINSALFISTILLGIVTLIESKYNGLSDFTSIIEMSNGSEKVSQLLPIATSRLTLIIKENEEKNGKKYKYLQHSFKTFVSGIIIVIILFCLIFRLILYL